MCTGAEGLLLGGAGLSAFGSLRSGQALKEEAKDAADIKDQRAAVERRNTAIQVRRMRAESSRLQGTRRAAAAASGVDTASGTPLDIRSQAAADSEFEVLLAEAQGERAARRLEEEASAQRKRGKNLQRASLFRAGATAITAGAIVHGGKLG